MGSDLDEETFFITTTDGLTDSISDTGAFTGKRNPNGYSQLAVEIDSRMDNANLG